MSRKRVKLFSSYFLWLFICVGLSCCLGGCGSNSDVTNSTGNSGAGPIFRVEQLGNGVVQLTALNSDLSSIKPPADASAQVPSAQNSEGIRARINSVGPWVRVLNRWSLDSDSTTEFNFSDSDPVSAYVTDAAIYPPGRLINIPSASGTYIYTWDWKNTKDSQFRHTIELVKTAGGLTGRHRLNDEPYTSIPGLSGSTTSLNVHLGMGLSRDSEPPSGVLASFSDDILEQSYIGTWTVIEDMAGVVTPIGQFDLRMLALKNPRAVPAQFNPALPDGTPGSSTTLKADVVALPYTTENDTDGWQPAGAVNWKMWVTQPDATQVKTLSGSVNVTTPDSTGKIGEISTPWRGEQDGASGTLSSGNYSFKILALAPIGANTNIRTRPASSTVKIGDREVTLNATVAPEQFDPSAGGTAILSFDIDTRNMGSSPEIDWQVSIADKATHAKLHDFLPASRPGVVSNDTGTSLHVELSWDGKHAGVPVAPEFEWKIRATASQLVAGTGAPVVEVAQATIPNAVQGGLEVFDASLSLADPIGSSADTTGNITQAQLDRAGSIYPFGGRARINGVELTPSNQWVLRAEGLDFGSSSPPSVVNCTLDSAVSKQSSDIQLHRTSPSQGPWEGSFTLTNAFIKPESQLQGNGGTTFSGCDSASTTGLTALAFDAGMSGLPAGSPHAAPLLRLGNMFFPDYYRPRPKSGQASAVTTQNLRCFGFEDVLVSVDSTNNPNLKKDLLVSIKVRNPASVAMVSVHGDPRGILGIGPDENGLLDRLDPAVDLQDSDTKTLKTLILPSCHVLDLHDYNNNRSQPADPITARFAPGVVWRGKVGKGATVLLGYNHPVLKGTAQITLARYFVELQRLPQAAGTAEERQALAWLAANYLSYKENSLTSALNACAWVGSNYYYISFSPPARASAPSPQPSAPRNIFGFYKIPLDGNGDNVAIQAAKVPPEGLDPLNIPGVTITP